MKNDVLKEIATMVPVSFPDGLVLNNRDISVGRVGHDIICCARRWLWDNYEADVRHSTMMPGWWCCTSVGKYGGMFYADTEEECILKAIKSYVSDSPAPPAQASEPVKPLGTPPTHIMATKQDIADLTRELADTQDEAANFDNRITDLEKRVKLLLNALADNALGRVRT